MSALLALLLTLPARQGWGYRIGRAAWCRAGVFALAFYLSAQGVAQHVALRRVEEFAMREHLRVESLGALPLPPSLLRWSGLIRTPNGVYQGRFDLLDGEAAKFRFFGDSEANGYVKEALALPTVRTYLWFARFPLIRYVGEGGQHTVEFRDLRFSRGDEGASGFTYRVTFDGNGKVVQEGWAGG